MDWKNLIRPIERWASRLGVRLAILIISFLPLKFIRWLSPLMGELTYLFVRRHRLQALRNLKLAYGNERPLSQIKSMAREAFRCGGRCAADAAFFYSRYQTKRAVDLINHVDGEGRLREAVQRGEGVIAISAHLGNFMLLASKLSSMGYPNTTIMRQMRDEKLEGFFKKARDKIGQSYISKLPTPRSAREALRWLKDGNLLFLYIDQRSEQGIEVDFFGIPTQVPTGAAVFALKTEAPVVPIFIVQGEDGFYKLIVGHPIEIDRTGDLEKDIHRNMAKFAKVIEAYISRYPTQWFWLHRLWKGSIGGSSPRRPAIRPAIRG